MLSLVYSVFFRHGYLPNCPPNVTIVPLLNKKGSGTSFKDNYRLIDLCTPLSKLLELCTLLKIENNLQTSQHQFGFKKGVSTNMTTYILIETINLFLYINN